MTADEARAMSDARAEETPLHRWMRLFAYPCIQNRADQGRSDVSIPITRFGERGCYVPPELAYSDIANQLKVDGYVVDDTFLYYTDDPELRISW